MQSVGGAVALSGFCPLPPLGFLTVHLSWGLVLCPTPNPKTGEPGTILRLTVTLLSVGHG
jgi:hypothetical protein